MSKTKSNHDGHGILANIKHFFSHASHYATDLQHFSELMTKLHFAFEKTQHAIERFIPITRILFSALSTFASGFALLLSAKTKRTKAVANFLFSLFVLGIVALSVVYPILMAPVTLILLVVQLGKEYRHLNHTNKQWYLSAEKLERLKSRLQGNISDSNYAPHINMLESQLDNLGKQSINASADVFFGVVATTGAALLFIPGPTQMVGLLLMVATIPLELGFKFSHWLGRKVFNHVKKHAMTKINTLLGRTKQSTKQYVMHDVSSNIICEDDLSNEYENTSGILTRLGSKMASTGAAITAAGLIATGSMAYAQDVDQEIRDSYESCEVIECRDERHDEHSISGESLDYSRVQPNVEVVQQQVAPSINKSHYAKKYAQKLDYYQDVYLKNEALWASKDLARAGPDENYSPCRGYQLPSVAPSA